MLYKLLQYALYSFIESFFNALGEEAAKFILEVIHTLFSYLYKASVLLDYGWQKPRNHNVLYTPIHSTEGRYRNTHLILEIGDTIILLAYIAHLLLG